MSCGVMICSRCKREVHEAIARGGDWRRRNERYWYHCEDSTMICLGASPIYAKDRSEVKGKACWRDDFDPAAA